MKKLFTYTLLTLSCFSFLPTAAQSEVPEFFPQGTSWEEARFGHQEGDRIAFFTHLRHTVSGDTLIDGTLYKKVVTEMKILDSYDSNGGLAYLWYVDADFDWDNIGPWHWEVISSNNFGLREENGIVYVNYINFGYGVERKLYDFNWEVGKEMEEYNTLSYQYENYILNDIQEITLLDGSVAQCLYSEDGKQAERIRGIGFVDSFFDTIFLDAWGSITNFRHMINFSRNGVLLYEWDPMAYLESTTGIRQIMASPSENKGTAYTITGVGMKEDACLRAGIYIKNGKKMIVR